MEKDLVAFYTVRGDGNIREESLIPVIFYCLGDGSICLGEGYLLPDAESGDTLQDALVIVFDPVDDKSTYDVVGRGHRIVQCGIDFDYLALSAQGGQT